MAAAYHCFFFSYVVKVKQLIFASKKYLFKKWQHGPSAVLLKNLFYFAVAFSIVLKIRNHAFFVEWVHFKYTVP